MLTNIVGSFAITAPIQTPGASRGSPSTRPKRRSP